MRRRRDVITLRSTLRHGSFALFLCGGALSLWFWELKAITATSTVSYLVLLLGQEPKSPTART